MVAEEHQRLMLRTQRLALRGVTLDDVPAIYAIQNNPNTIRFLRPMAVRVQPYQIELVRDLVKNRVETNLLFMNIYLLPDEKHVPTPDGRSPYDPTLEFPSVTSEDVCGDLIGTVGLKPDHELGYMIRYEDWGKGLAAEAVAGVIREVWRRADSGEFGTLPQAVPEGEVEERQYLTGAINPENQGSRRVLEKVGGVSAGTKDVPDWDQTQEEKDRDGVKYFTLQFFRVYRPVSLNSS